MKAKKTQPKFSVGQKVIFINDYGVNWGEKTLTKYEWNEVRGHTWQYEDTQTPWFCSSERNFYDPKDAEGISKATLIIATESSHYTAPPINWCLTRRYKQSEGIPWIIPSSPFSEIAWSSALKVELI